MCGEAWMPTSYGKAHNDDGEDDDYGYFKYHNAAELIF